MDELQRTIGQLMAQMDAMLDQQRTLAAELSDLAEQQAEIKERVLAMQYHQESLAKGLAAMEPDIKFINNLKQRGIGVLSVFGVFCTFLGYYFDKIIKQ